MIKLSIRDKFAEDRPDIVVTATDTLNSLWTKIRGTDLYKQKGGEIENHVGSWSDSPLNSKGDLMQRASDFFNFIDEAKNEQEDNKKKELLEKIDALRIEIFSTPDSEIASSEFMEYVKDLKKCYTGLVWMNVMTDEEIKEKEQKLNYWVMGKLKNRVVRQSERLSKPMFVQLLRDVNSKGITAKMGDKGQITWEGEDKYHTIKIDDNGTVVTQSARLFLVTLGEEYSKSKEGKIYIKSDKKVYTSEADVIKTTIPGDYYIQKQEKQDEKDTGDWDDKQPNETWPEFYARMRAARRSRHPEWGKRW